jgi:putative transposase
VEKRNIFLNDKDYFRFIHDLFEFNDEELTFNVAYYFNSRSQEIKFQYLEKERKPRKLLVEILVFTLMPNHFHLLLRQKKEKGIVKFMQKLGTGYTNYFNKKYERVGGLFQGRFKAALVNKEAHFIHLPYYIHTNPLDLIYGSSTPIDWKKQMDFLENYRWSSYLDYIGKKNFPSITSREFLLEFLGGEKEYKKTIQNWLKEKDEEIENIKEIILE